MSIIPLLPFTIADGQTESAGPVMANFLQIFNYVNAGAAASGVNADITQLSALTTPITVAQGGTGASTGAGLADGCCYLSYVSTSQIILKPKNGNRLTIAGTSQTIPSAGVTMSNSGCVIGTGGNLVTPNIYYIYAYMVGSNITLGASVTSHTTDTTTGTEVMSTDATKRLVGMLLANGGTPGTFQETSLNKTVMSWFNRVRRTILTAVTGATSSTSFIPVSNNLFCMAWAGDSMESWTSGYSYNVSGGASTSTQIFFNAAGVGNQTIFYSAVANAQGGFSCITLTGGTENAYQTFCVYGLVSSSSGQWSGIHYVVFYG